MLYPIKGAAYSLQISLMNSGQQRMKRPLSPVHHNDLTKSIRSEENTQNNDISTNPQFVSLLKCFNHLDATVMLLCRTGKDCSWESVQSAYLNASGQILTSTEFAAIVTICPGLFEYNWKLDRSLGTKLLHIGIGTNWCDAEELKSQFSVDSVLQRHHHFRFVTTLPLPLPLPLSLICPFTTSFNLMYFCITTVALISSCDHFILTTELGWNLPQFLNLNLYCVHQIIAFFSIHKARYLRCQTKSLQRFEHQTIAMEVVRRV